MPLTQHCQHTDGRKGSQRGLLMLLQYGALVVQFHGVAIADT